MVEASSPKKRAPEGYKVLTEGQANVLYIEEQAEKDDQNRVKNAMGGKR